MQINQSYLGKFSRDALKILHWMTKQYPKQKVFSNNKLGGVINLKGQALGGVLGTFSQKSGIPLIIKVGTVSTSWSNEKFSRPTQMWALNPQLKEDEIKQIKEILDNFLLDY